MQRVLYAGLNPVTSTIFIVQSYHSPPLGVFSCVKSISLICVSCGATFEKQLKEYRRQLKKKRTSFFCSLKCFKENLSKNPITKYIRGTGKCEICGKEIPIKIGCPYNRKTCSRDCACKLSRKISLQRHPDMHLRASETMRNNWAKIPHSKKLNIRHDLNCKICGKTFSSSNFKPPQTCSKDCYRKLVSIYATNHPNCGGETNFKKFKYNGVTMDSSWEVEIAKFLDANNIKWIRDRHIMFWWTDKDGQRRRYYPDFFLPEYNIYLDPKNKFLLVKDFFKLEKVKEENGITLFYGLKDELIEKLKNIFSLSMSL